MCAYPLLFLTSILTGLKAPSGASYTVQVTDDPSRRQSPHPLLAPITGASLLMSLSAYNAAGIGMLSTSFSTITGIVGLWGLWTVRLAILSYVAVSEIESVRSSLPALVDARNLGQINAPPPSSSTTNLQRRKSRKARGGNSPSRPYCSSSEDNCLALSGSQASGSWIMYVMFPISCISKQVHYLPPRPIPPIILSISDMLGIPPNPPKPPSPPKPPPICCIMPTRV